MRRHRQSQLGNTEYLQKILLVFLIGFFIGAVFYYIFQHSFTDLSKQLEYNITLWTHEGDSSWKLLMSSLWQHGKYLLLFAIFSIGPLKKAYQKIFVWYTGLRSGFLLMFFLCAKGAFGLLLYPLSLIPHGLFLVPLYLYSFSTVNENRQDKGQITKWIIVILVYIAACVLEVKVNLPMMEALL